MRVGQSFIYQITVNDDMRKQWRQKPQHWTYCDHHIAVTLQTCSGGRQLHRTLHTIFFLLRAPGASHFVELRRPWSRQESTFITCCRINNKFARLPICYLIMLCDIYIWRNLTQSFEIFTISCVPHLEQNRIEQVFIC